MNKLKNQELKNEHKLEADLKAARAKFGNIDEDVWRHLLPEVRKQYLLS